MTHERVEKLAGDVQMPVVAYLRADAHSNPIWTDDCACQDAVYPSDPDGSDADDVSMPMVRQADAQAALSAKDAVIFGMREAISILTADRDSWYQQHSNRLDDALKFATERDALRLDAARYRMVKEKKWMEPWLEATIDAEIAKEATK